MDVMIDVACSRALHHAQWRTSTSFMDGAINYMSPRHWRRCSTIPSTAAANLRFVPTVCPELSLPMASRCLLQRGLQRVIFLGDSTTVQLVYTALCEVGHPICAPKSITCDAATATSVVNHRSFLLHFVRVAGLEIGILWTKPTSGRAGAYGWSIREAFRAGALLQPALWMVNFGLWHLTSHDSVLGCETGNMQRCRQVPVGTVPCSEERLKAARKQYRGELAGLLHVLSINASGPILWRDTTAVHPDRMQAGVTASVLSKFKCFGNGEVARLNSAALQTIVRFPRVAVAGHAFNATLPRADHTLDGDIRHYDGVVMRELLHLTFLDWCGPHVKMMQTR